jgi:chromosome segregation ATPase
MSTQYQQLAHELSALATRYRSLQQELTEMQTDALAHENMMAQYERQLSAWQPPVLERKEPDIETQMLLAKIRELQEENADMQQALNSASDLLVASQNRQRLSRNGSE